MLRPARILNDIYDLFFPVMCPGCATRLSPNEQVICTECRHRLPETGYHRTKENPVEKMFYGRVKIESGTAFLLFHKKGITQQLIHHLKYKKRENIGTLLGMWYGHLLSESGFGNTIDMVIPVPLHPKKQRKRGYNQVSGFAKCLAGALRAAYREDILVKTDDTGGQTFKNKMSRWKESESIFGINPDIQLPACHILLVDDVITTGATLERCTRTLQKHKNVKVSVATMAITV